MKNNLPMTGVFDSGLGGLFLLKELSQKIKEQQFIYLADNIHFPYGEKKPALIRSLVKKNIKFLTEQGAKRVIVACNTASAVLEEPSSHYPVPVIGVIEPALKQAYKDSINKKVGLLATTGTVRSKIFLKKAKKLKLDLQIYQQACPYLAPFVEKGGWKTIQKHRNKAENNKLRLLLKEYLNPLLSKGVDTIIMGCTHYLYLKPAIEKYIGAEKKATGPVDFLIQDLSQVKNLNRLKNETFLKSKPLLKNKTPLKIQFFITKDNKEFKEQCRNIYKNHIKINIKKVLIL